MTTRDVLIVEDSADIRDFMEIVFSRVCRCRTLTVGSLKEALEALETAQFDLMVLDYRIHQDCALDVMDAIDRGDVLRPKRVICASGYDLSPEIQARFDGFLLKPFGPRDLCSLVV